MPRYDKFTIKQKKQLTKANNEVEKEIEQANSHNEAKLSKEIKKIIKRNTKKPINTQNLLKNN